MTKKIIWGLMGIIFMLLCFSCNQTSTYAPNRHQYSTETRTVLDKNNDDAMAIELPAELLFFEEIVASDLIISGRVSTDGEVKERLLSADEPFGPTITTTFFQIEVREVWFGQCRENEITLSILGDLESYATKPLKNDEVILFLRYSEDLGYYVLTNSDEESIFVINPPNNTLYAFSFADTLTAFDGSRPSELKKAIENIYQEFSEMTEWKYPHIGAVAYNHLDENNPIHQKETQRREYQKAYKEKMEQSSHD